jgi:hypothetical protein
MVGVPIFDFPVLSDEPRQVGEFNRDEAPPGVMAVYEEQVWELVGDRQPGEELGWVAIQETAIADDRTTKLFVATFRLDGHGPIVVTGFVPGDGSWKGVGRGEAHGAGRRGSVRIEGWNPKGWG